MKTHNLKSWCDSFARILAGDQTFDVRKDDRQFELHDLVVFEEFRHAVGTYTGRQVTAQITALTSPTLDNSAASEGLKLGYCVLGFIVIAQTSQQ